MALAQQVFVFAGAVDEDGLPVEVEAVVGGLTVGRGPLSQHGPRDAAYAEGRAHLVGGLVVALNHGGQGVEVGVADGPAVHVADGLGMAEGASRTGLDGDGLGMAEHLLARGQRELVDQLYGLGLAGIVLYLGLDEDAVAGSVVPDVHAEGLNAHLVGLDERDGSEDAEGL